MHSGEEIFFYWKERTPILFNVMMAVKSVEIYLEALSFIRKRGAVLGIDSFAENYKPMNVLSSFLFFDVVTFTMITVYLCFFEYFGDLEKLTFCFVTYGLGIQVRNHLRG